MTPKMATPKHSSSERFTRTKKQREWRTNYWQQTGFEFSDDTREPFANRAHTQLEWFMSHAKDAHYRLENDLNDLLNEESYARQSKRPSSWPRS